MALSRICTQLESLPELSTLTQLQMLNASFCYQLASLPELSALTQLQTLGISMCKKLASLPEPTLRKPRPVAEIEYESSPPAQT